MKIFRSALILLPLLVASNAAMLRKKEPPHEQGNVRHRQLDEGLPSQVPTASPGDNEFPTVSPGDTEVPGFPDCIVDAPEFVGDGWCDSFPPYNTAACGFDGGDCCENTCQDGLYECGVEAPFHCQDPSEPTSSPYPTQAPVPTQPPLVDIYPNCLVESPEWVGDGWCDSDGDYNTEACGYDGGDCFSFLTLTLK
eukprot:CAMPEP_0202507218 /NCGR_PEP_ID=MMETSP1361-20130828/51610_1 /ASSEMBLY_ACC=CAM_ASM_000849 /TAXON_ID=210615 /ORGANISM="Staurosira complex sp., Strain CCMP2646" /LENGTH=194 /DNA_ID=CAMNT_0049141327 /DNA_START=541 /DNA_END=1125 /DNA_ORIENTATION=-